MQNKTDELKYYEIASIEFDSGKTIKGILAKAKVDSMGDSSKLEANYIKLRVEVLSEERGQVEDLKGEQHSFQNDSAEVLFVELNSLPEKVSQSLRSKTKINFVIDSINAIHRHSKAIHKIGDTLILHPKECLFRSDGKFAKFRSMGIEYKGEVLGSWA